MTDVTKDDLELFIERYDRDIEAHKDAIQDTEQFVGCVLRTIT